MLIKTNLIPSPFDAVTVWPFIFIRPQAARDPGLLAHEQLHYQRMSWITPVWWLRYAFDRVFRVREEVLAYQISIQYGMPLQKAALWLCQYDKRMTPEWASLLLSGRAAL